MLGYFNNSRGTVLGGPGAVEPKMRIFYSHGLVILKKKGGDIDDKVFRRPFSRNEFLGNHRLLGRLGLRRRRFRNDILRPLMVEKTQPRRALLVERVHQFGDVLQ